MPPAHGHTDDKPHNQHMILHSVITSRTAEPYPLDNDALQDVQRAEDPTRKVTG